jgi:methionine aminopeptidase
LDKGIAFPTSVSPNHCAGHFSPLPNEPAVLSEGDIVKIDLGRDNFTRYPSFFIFYNPFRSGVHIDGHIAVVGHTCIATVDPASVTGRKADVICAAHFAAEVFCGLALTLARYPSVF